MLLVAALAACAKQKPIVPKDLMPPEVERQGPSLTYAEIAERYNGSLENLDRLWSATNVKLAWRDDEGKAHFEEGEGKFLFVPPMSVALTVEKVGKTFVWAGADSERFWMFQRQDDVAFVGRHANVGKPCARPLPLPVQPASVPHLLGLVPLPRAATDEPVEMVAGHYLIEPAGTNVRLMLDPQTLRPVRVDLTDDRGHSFVICRIAGQQRVQIDGIPIPQQPLIPTQADLYVVGEEARMTLVLDRATTSEAKIQARAFDFDALSKAMKPRETVVLDADCE